MKNVGTFFLPALMLWLASLASTPALAGAWPQEEGNWQIIHSVSLYSADEFFDPLGNNVPQSTFTQRQYNPYIEYGWKDHTTLGINAFVQSSSSNGDSNLGLADVELFARTRLWAKKMEGKDSEAVISIQPVIKLPSFADDDSLPTLGNSNTDLALSVLGGYSFNYFGEKTFTETELQYRLRLGTPEDQVRISGTIGQDINSKWQIIAQSFTTISIDSVSGADVFTQSSGDDFDLQTMQLTAVHHYNDQISLQAGAAYDVLGRNTSKGARAIFAIWHRF